MIPAWVAALASGAPYERHPSLTRPSRRLRAVKPKLPADFEDVTWAKLRDAVQAVNSKRAVSCSLEELYRVRR